MSASCEMLLSRSVDMRYAGQWRQLTINIAPGDRMAGVLSRFHNEHQRAFAFRDQTRPVEVYAVRLVAKGTLPKPPSVPTVKSASKPAPFGTRPVFFSGIRGHIDTPLYRRDVLTSGARVEGPAIIEQLDSTVVLPPGTNSVVTADMHVVTRFTGAA